MKLLVIVGAVVILAVGVSVYFIARPAAPLPDDLGAATPEQMFIAIAEAARNGDIASAERYFSSQNSEGRKVWANILAVNKENELLGHLADSFASASLFKEISLEYQQFLIYNKPQPQGILADVTFSPELSLWQIQDLKLVNIEKK